MSQQPEDGTQVSQDSIQLFPIAIGSYREHENLDVESQVARIRTLLWQFRCREVDWPVATDDRDGNAVDDRLKAWSEPDDAENSLLYWVGHGWSDGLQVALAHSRSPAAVRVFGVSPDKIAEAIRSRQLVSQPKWAIVVIDACRSKEFVDKVTADLDSDGLLIVGVAGEGPTSLGRFASVFEACLNDNFKTKQHIDLWQLAAELDRRLPEGRVTGRRLADAKIIRSSIPISGILAVPLSVASELEEALSRLTPDERYHFLRKAQGAEEGELSWYFEGREHERTVIANWVNQNMSGMLIVTGAAGSGKSALLGYVLISTLPELRAALKTSGLMPAAAGRALPPSNLFDEVIHMTGITLRALIARIAEAAGINDMLDLTPAGSTSTTAANADSLIVQISQRKSPLTLLVDALDEAVDPIGIARNILTPLSRLPLVRVIVGTRRSTSETLDQLEPVDSDILDALGATGGGQRSATVVKVDHDRDAVTRYTKKRLQSARASGHLDIDGQPVPDDAIEHAAEQIGSHNRHFLFARLAVHEILADPTLLEPSRSVTLHRLLTNDHRSIFASAVGRITRVSDSFQPLLEALALARGRGVPIRHGVWALMASALLDEPSVRLPITDDDVSRLLRVGQPYISADTELGQTVYRLSHRTFVEYFLREWGHR